ncbi:MAG TPA: CAP domain-containing protein [Steroidobacteraceae bacterium]|nr:CAP domain-containing protein [Steroidobacteraceae bacterium]
MRALLPLIAGLGLALALPRAAGADVLATVNWARLHSCATSAPRASLQNNPKLQKAAGRLSYGAALHDALTAVGYVASESAALHFSGAASDAQIARMLTANYCRTLIDPALREIGAERRGRDVWVILAAPVSMPTAADAVAVSRRILELVNAARAAGRRCGAKYFAPAAPLTLEASLTRAALAHSEEMARYSAFDHRGHDGSTPAQRVERAGYGVHRIVGENIAAGAMSPTEVTDGWLASPAHCENIMDGRFTQIGIAYAASANPEVGLYWTQDFAAPH